MASSPREANPGRADSKSETEAERRKGSHSGAATSPFCITNWDRTKFLSDFIAEGLTYLDNKERDDDPSSGHDRHHLRSVIMLYEAPSTFAEGTSFHNSHKYRVHDYPPSPQYVKTVMDPCRYSLGNGSAYPSYLKDGAPPPGLMEHWEETIPDWVMPSFTDHIPDSPCRGVENVDGNTMLVYTYLPCEAIARDRHVIDPAVHHYLCGKDILPLVTSRTPRLLESMQPHHRPCIAKTTHSSGSRGIFVIRNDNDERTFQRYWEDAHRPQFVITDLICDIRRNVACHFFIHPNGQDIVIFGSSENFRFDGGGDNEGFTRSLPYSSDSYWSWSDQDMLLETQRGLVHQVATYCHSVGFWGFCGIDVLQDTNGLTHLIDLNPRVTGSLPSLLVANLFHGRFGYDHGIFRRSGPATYFHGSSRHLLDAVARFNSAHSRECQVVVFSFYELLQRNRTVTKIQIGVYGRSLERCQQVLGEFAHEAEEN